MDSECSLESNTEIREASECYYNWKLLGTVLCLRLSVLIRYLKKVKNVIHKTLYRAPILENFKRQC